MLTGIEVYNEFGTLVLTLPVAIPNPTSHYVVTDIDGLEPVKADISTASHASMDGVFIQNSTTSARNIVMSLAYGPSISSDRTVQALRRDLYSYFPPKGPVRLRFISDDFVSVEATGMVETNEPAIFTKDPETQISILCEDPYFSDIRQYKVTSLNDTWNDLPNVGTAPTGFVFFIGNMPRVIPWVRLTNGVDPTLTVDRDFAIGDDLEISTRRFKKYITHTQGTAENNGLDGLFAGSMSMAVGGRRNRFSCTIDGTKDVTYSLYYTPKYLGL